MGALIGHNGLLFGGGAGVVTDAFAKSILHLDGSNGSTSFPDEKPVTWTAFGGAAISTAQSKFGGASLFLDGTLGKGINTIANANLAPTTNDFTVEMWVYQTANSGDRTLWMQTVSTGLSVGLQAGKLFAGPAGISYGPIASSAISLNTWTHVAACRSGSTMRVFHDGVLMGSAADNRNYPQRLTNIGVASLNDNGTFAAPFAGYIDEVRFTLGLARYTTGFTPPSSPFVP